MASKRWIKLWRKAIDDPIFYGNAQKFGFWCWMCSKAMTKDGYYPLGRETVYLKRGQFVFGRKTAAKATGISETTLYRWLNQFEQMGMIRKHVVAHQYTLIEVSKYAAYQDDYSKDVAHETAHTVTRTVNTVVEDIEDRTPRTKAAEELSPCEVLEENPFGEDPLVLYERWKRENGN